VNLFQELAYIFADDETERDRVFREILGKLSSLMSDRASVMKSFNSALSSKSSKRKDILGEDSTQLQHIYCSAHFLLGLGSECEKALKDVQTGIGDGKHGRDQLVQLRNWSSSGETVVARYIRTACDVLGPRGDDLSGCRDAWEAYCGMMGIQSRIKSFQSNRFINYFEAAAALHYHHAQGFQIVFE
jgi:aubergine-like protein